LWQRTIRDVPLGALTPRHIQQAQADLSARYAPGTLHLAHARLKHALRSAVRWKLIAEHPMDGLRPPRVEKPPQVVWTAAQLALVRQAVREGEDAALWTVLCDTVARFGELLALTWADYDAEDGSLTIRRTLTRDADRHPILGATTKGKEARWVGLLPETVTLLDAHRDDIDVMCEAAADSWQAWGLIFPRYDGRWQDDNTTRRRWERCLRALDVPYLTPHGVRHTITSIAIANGAPIKAVARRMGHADAAFTLNTYVHPHCEEVRGVTEVLRKALEG
jgi:integrase